MKIKLFLSVLPVILLMAACTTTAPVQPAITDTPATTIVPTLIPTFTPEPTLVPTATVHPTSTQFNLPLNEHNYEGVYCQYPPVKLPVAEAQGLNEDEIAERLLGMTLAYFNAPEAPDWCRVDGYTIDGISYDELTPLLPLEPKGDWMRAVKYSVKLIQVPNFWMSLPGTIDQQNWLHTYGDLAIFRQSDGFTMAFAHP
jgi:hypothetical protein